MTAGTIITDPSRLLTEVSSDPFWVENRRREAQHNAIAGLKEKIKSFLHHYYWDLLIMPRGVGKCPYPWEIELSEKILDSFIELEEDIEDALEKIRVSCRSGFVGLMGKIRMQ